MLGWAVFFFIIAIVAAVLGFWTIAGTAAWIAKVLFVLFIILFIVSLIRHLAVPRTTVVERRVVS